MARRQRVVTTSWADLALLAINRHPTLALLLPLTLALQVCLGVLDMARQATPADVAASTVEIRSEVALVSGQLSVMAEAQKNLAARQGVTEGKVVALANGLKATDARVASLGVTLSDADARLRALQNEQSRRTRTDSHRSPDG